MFWSLISQTIEKSQYNVKYGMPAPMYGVQIMYGVTPAPTPISILQTVTNFFVDNFLLMVGLTVGLFVGIVLTLLAKRRK